MILVCVCVYVVIPFILDVRFVDVLAGVTQEEGHTGLLYLTSTVVALIFLARRIQLFPSLVDEEKSQFDYSSRMTKIISQNFFVLLLPPQ